VSLRFGENSDEMVRTPRRGKCGTDNASDIFTTGED